MNKTGKSFVFKSSLMAVLLTAALGAHAAGLGKLTVFSAIGQPLNAEVAITATPEELNTLSARLASHDAFRDAGIDVMPALTGLRFTVLKPAGGAAVVKLTTDAPLNEPFLHFLLELNWTAGRMVREYTFLLDPPEMLQVQQPAVVVTPSTAVVSSTSAAPVRTPVPVGTAQPAIVAPMAPTAQANQPVVAAPKASADTSVQVRTGDSLSRIAREHLPQAVTLEQMLVALFNKNRSEFEGDNMNRLRAGKILRLPEASEAAQVAPGEARKLVMSQGADFNAYRRRLAEAAGGGIPVADGAAQLASGKIQPKVEESSTATPAKDKLEVSRTEATKATGTGLSKADSARQARLEEELVARDKSLREAAERIAQLEKNLENLKKLVELKSQAGADLQQQALAGKPATAAPPVPVPPTVTSAPAKVESPPAPAAPEAKPAAEAAPAAASEVRPTTPQATPKPAAKKPVSPPPPPPPEPSFVEDNPEIVFGGGGVIALLLAYLGLSAWRKKKAVKTQEKANDAVSEPQVLPVAAAPIVVTPAVAEEMSILGDFSESGELTAEENVDPVAEADVLMAYGRDAQAEEILLEGLKKDPERTAIHTKLLELYVSRQDAGRFEEVAADVRRVSGGVGADWDKTLSLAAGLGVRLDGAATVSAESAVPAVAGSGLPQIEESFLAQVVETPVAIAATEAADPGETVVMSVPPLAEVPLAEAPAASSDLDFDLDLGTTSGPAAAAAAEQATAAPADEVMSLDFDFDLGTPDQPAVAVESAKADEIGTEGLPLDDNAIDFALDIGPPAAEPAATSELPDAEPAVEAAGNEIDFDIDLGEPPAGMETSGAPLAVAAESPVASDLDIDFDLDLGGDAKPVAEVEAFSEPQSSLVEEGVAGALMPDLSLDLELPSEDRVDLAEPVAAEPDFALDLELPEPLLASPEAPQAPEFPMPVEFPEVAANIEPPVAVAKEFAEIELPDLDLALAGEVVGHQAPEAVENQNTSDAESIDIPDIDLDADLSAPLPQAEAGAASSEDDPEVATKLELAQAYEEMGDREGARELLNEVLSEGSAAQQTAARTRLAQLEG